MRPRQLAVAAVILLGWTGGAAASQLIPARAGVSLQAHPDVEAVRWRHRRYRDFFWGGERRDSGRIDTDGFSANAYGPNRLTLPDPVRPDSRRRRGWVDPPPAQ
jgi:hypothetical protein